MIQLEQVSKVYRSHREEVHALDELSLEIEEGEFVAVLGRSGSGKSTLLSLIGGLSLPSSGRLVVAGRELPKLRPAERAAFRASHIGFVFQMFHLLPYLSVLDNVALAAPNGSHHEYLERANELLSQFGLDARRRHRPSELSAGERQRVAMARALLNKPQLLLADEPTGNLDAENTGALLDLLDRFHAAGGTILLATHDEMAAQRAGRQVRLDRGRRVAD